ncbi:superoxide dismutase [archaeon]|nr:superoxide dismutase [archaeon]|tara:strand:+ start:127 stop:744 length:618 start_codon:yes stop_codon:yes gene_type:complete
MKSLYKLPKLEYEYDSLEPFIDKKTMRIHHTKHHQSYVDKLNKALENNPELQGKTPEELIKNLNRIPRGIRTAVRNNGGGHVNHSFFWPILKKNKEKKAPLEITKAINTYFDNFDSFKEEFTNAAATLFGSGWAWLVLNNDKLEIITTQNQDSPLIQGKIPLLCIDVWEHAYYLKYQNKRPDYIGAFFNVVNWEKVNENYLNAIK